MIEKVLCVDISITYILLLTPRGFQHLANLTPVQAPRRAIAWLYDGIPLPEVFQPDQTQPKTLRNAEIRQRYAAGESMPALAAEYGISKQRVHQILAAAHD